MYSKGGACSLRTHSDNILWKPARSADNPDFPSFYYNALVWNLAGQLSYEYSVPLAERAMIDKKADLHRQRAEGFDVEEGSLYLMPQWEFGEG